MMGFGWPLIAWALAVFTLAGVVKGAAGFGFPMVSVPLLAQVMPVPQAIAWALVPTFAANLVQMVETRAHAAVVRSIWPLLAALYPVMLATVRLMPSMDPKALYLMVGVMIEVVALMQLTGRIPRVEGRMRLPLLLAAGAITGVLGGMTSFYGFPALQAFLAIGLGAHAFVFAASVMFLVGTLVLGAGLSTLGILGLDDLLVSALGLPAVALGLAIGQRIRHRASPALFRNLVLATLFVMGISMIAKGLA
ncbi:sulfite exporter TauE/SafE family protein [Azospirillum sp. TSO22-1]|uniref:sulfite exporter TauE/SafE family protein n=1 Tax=Azospirillum sp. TSO22-1 TaxID=716789 RepID=UPI000D64371E|nr:sulfite exporter TauE/SafE family protein [Azospirillum sp. TSO22-1]